MLKTMAAGIYIHIPFCKSRCSYCDFATDVYRSSEAVERYVNALVKEISDFGFQTSDSENKKQKTKNQSPMPQDPVETLYFGGGTPSLLSAGQLEKILGAIHKKFAVGAKIEF